MADTWRESAIVQAIQIIADKKIAQAGYDKTIKGLINKVIDSASGKYQIRYQDSLFEAYATSSKITYNKDQEVSILIPGNDWDRVKTILNSISSNANNYKQVPIVSDSYNTIGPNGSSLTQEIQLSSYISQSKVLLDGQGISFNDISNYIKRGDAIALGMKIRTAFADGQVGGLYGLRFNLIFKDDVNKEQIIKTYAVSNMDVIGHPYQLINSQWVQTLITDIDTENFVGISSIEAYCDGFLQNENKADIKDIFISNIKINGADVLSDQDLNNTILHINDSTNGNTLKGDITELPLVAQLKVNGKITTQNVVYYWFRENGTIFRGSNRYSGYAGDGWECLNYKDGNSFVPKSSNTFTFNSIEDNLANDSALALQKVTKVLCVAVYNNRDWIKGQIQINNNFITDDIVIRVKEGQVYTDRTTYFLDNGYPDLVCETNLEGNLEYIWSIKPARGRAEQVVEDSQITQEVAAAVSTWKEVQKKRDWMAPANARDFVQTEEYLAAENNYKQAQVTPYVSENIYYNFPIKSIIGYSTISCAVKEDGQYKGTASIVLYNKTQLEGMYSLNLEHGTQVFQYDGKGNSPTSPQLERKLEIQPLSFNLINNDGQEIPYDQIVNNGYVKWIIPNTQTLLKGDESKEHVTGELDITVTRADLPLAARDYNVYSNLSQFTYSIEDQYDSKKNINYIWLHIKYKDMQFDAYTNFTFPKDGDPGTNGTDFVAKIVPVTEDSLSLDTDRIYISNKEQNKIFDDSGFEVDKLKFQLYNNSRIVENIEASYWSCPPTLFSNNQTDARTGITTYLQKSDGLDGWNKPKIKDSGKILENILSDKPVDIIRGQYNSEDGLRYFAEYPVCTQFVESGYRLKIRPKSGFKYAIYLEDGTRPDYDNTLPFEVVIQKVDLDTGYWERVQDEQNEIVCTWYSIGNIEPEIVTGKTASFKPKDTFDGSNLNSAVVVNVADIGFLHVPIYMILNRYGHSALNGWDGNSIQLNANGDTILAPQIGAGKKQSSDNTFTGILMGDVKTANSTDTGIMGYDHGVRSIFMDAETGKTVLGKNNAGQIKIDPSLVVKTSTQTSWDNAKEAGLLYSNNYILPTETDITNGTNKGKKGITLNVQTYKPGNGMIIDLSTPQIGFGSGHFYLSKEGNIHASGDGDIAGWRISDNAFYKHDGTNKTGMRSNGDPAFYAGTNAQITGTYNFYVNHDGYLFSKSGQIAGWSISPTTLSKGGVTINSDNSSAFNYAFKANNSDGTRKFSVDYNGNLYSRAGDIAGWTIQEGQLSKKDASNNQLKLSPTEGISIVNGLESSKKFTVDNKGYLTSTSGKIGGWNITNTTLSGGNTIIDSGGSLSNSGGGNGTWAINNDGSASFTNINASGGNIGNYTISNGQLSNGNVTLTSDGKLQATGGHIGAVSIDNSGLHGTGFDITNNYARFTGLVVNSNGSVSSSGSGISGGGGGWNLGYGGGAVGGCGFGTGSTTGKLAVDTLEVSGKVVTWKELGCISGITLKKATNVFSAPTVQPTYKISGSITVPGYTLIIDGSTYNLPARTVDCSILNITTTSTWHDFKAPVQGLSFSHYNAQILGASEIQTEDLGD